MRHRNTKAILNRPADQRKAMIRNLITSLFNEGRLQTTDAKAKALVSEVEHLITRARDKETFNAVRELSRVIFTEEASKKALAYILALKEMKSGYTRTTKIGFRAGDNALKVQVELIDPR